MSPPNPATQERPLGERLFIATLLLGLGDMAGKVLALGITVIRTHSLTAAEFGGFGFIIQTIGMFAQIAGFSLGMAAARYVALYRSSDTDKTREVAQFITLVGLITTCTAVILMLTLAPQMTQSLPGLTEPLRWSTLVLASQTISGLFLGLLSGLERFRAITLIVFLQNVVMLAFTAWWAPIWGLNGTLWAMTTGFVVVLVLAIWQCRDLIGGRWASLKQLWSHHRILIDFCLPSLLGGLIIVPATWLSQTIIASRHGPVEPLLAGLFVLPPSWLTGLGLAFEYSIGLRQIALFTAANQFSPLLALLTNLVAQPMMPLVSGQILKAEDPALSKEERHRAQLVTQRAIERSFQLAACLILPAHAFFAFAAPYMMALFGRTFAVHWSIFLAVLAWGAMTGMTTLIGVAMNAHGKVWLQNMFLSLYGLLLLSVTWALQSWGEFALATGYLVATLLPFLLSCVILYRTSLLGMRAIVVQFLAIGWITLISLISLWMPASWRLISIPLAVGITFFILYSFLKTESRQVILLLTGKLRGRLARKVVQEADPRQV